MAAMSSVSCTLRFVILAALLAGCAPSRGRPALQDPASSQGDASTELAADMDAEVLSCTPVDDCTDYSQTIYAEGTSPFGTVKLTRISVKYLITLSNNTVIRFSGTAGGYPIEIFAAHNDQNVWPAGKYASYAEPKPTTTTRVGVSACGTEIDLNANVSVERHLLENAEDGKPGMPIELKGFIDITQEGWLLRTPFNLTTACDYRVLPI